MEINRGFPREQVVHGPAQLMSAHGERCGFAVCVCELGNIRFSWLTLADEPPGRFGTGPASVHGANLFPGRPQPCAVRFCGAFHHATIRDEIVHAGKASKVLNLIEEDQRQDLSNPRHRLQAGKGLHIISLRTAGERAFDLAKSLSRVINERHLDCNGFADTGIGEMRGHVCALGCVRQPLANLREIVLTLGIMAVRSEFRALAGQMTTAPQ